MKKDTVVEVQEINVEKIVAQIQPKVSADSYWKVAFFNQLWKEEALKQKAYMSKYYE